MGGVAPMWNDYTYDTKTGNRTGLTYHSAAGTASPVTYAYPAAGAAKPHSVGTVTGPVDLGAGSYTYDAAGNQTGRPGQTLTYNEVGKVSKVVTGSNTQTNIYNPDGSLLLRVNSTEGAALFLGDTTVTRPAGSATTTAVRTYAGDGGKPIAERSGTTGSTGTTLTWLFTGLDGTVESQTNASTGTTTRQYRDPFGSAIGGATGVWGDGTGFLGKPATTSTKLTTIGARTYDPVLGKFTSVDPILANGDPQQTNGYEYANNNPITLADPTGLKPLGATDNGDWLAKGTILDAGEIVQAAIDYKAKLFYIASHINDSGRFTNIRNQWTAGAAYGGMVLGQISAFSQSLSWMSPMRPGFMLPLGEESFSAEPTTGGTVGARTGSLSSKVASTFEGGNYSEVTASSPTTLYRVFGGSASKMGAYWTRTLPTDSSNARSSLALDPSWGNTAENWVSIRVPQGTTFYEGNAAPQGPLPGGGSQVLFTSKVDESWVSGGGTLP